MKIKGPTEFAWVTIINGQQNVINARLLVASLKRVITSHQSIAVCLGNDLADKNRSELTSDGFDHVVSTDSVGTLDDTQTVNIVFGENGSTRELLRKFKKIVLLPVDCIVLKNCDELMKENLIENNSSPATSSDNVNLVATALEQCLVISPGEEQNSTENSLHVSSPIFFTLHGSPTLQTDCLENVPSIVRLPKITSETIPSVLASVTGILEKEILNYWETLHNNLGQNNTGNTNDDDDCLATWNSEPIAIIGTADSCATLTDATKCALAESGMSPSLLSPASCAVFTAVSYEPMLTTFTESIKDSSPFLSSLGNTACTSSISAVTCAVKKLLDDDNITTCLVYYRDSTAKISVLVLKRISQAILDGDNIQAALGSCSLSKSLLIKHNLQQGDNAINNDSIELLDLVAIVRFLNIRGPIVNQPWLSLAKLCDSHKRESVVIPHFEPVSSSSLVISASYLEQVEKQYPKWTLKSNFNNSSQRSLHCIALQHCGNSTNGLDKIVENLGNFLTTNKSSYSTAASFTDLAFTLNSKLLASSQCENSHQPVSRAVIIAKDVDEACKQLSTKTFLKEEMNASSNKQKQKLCFLFTGQGSQYAGMAKTLYETCPVFRLSLDRCNFQFRKMYNIDIHDVIYKNSAELSRTLYSQTSIFCIEYALLQTWKSWGIEPDYVVGHSLGEFCAAVAAGALEMEDALKLVAERSRLIDELPRGKMLVLRGDERGIQDLLAEFTQENYGSWLDFAAINSKLQTVLSGDSRWVEMFQQFAAARKVNGLVLEATHAFHSRHMNPMLDKYRKVIETCKGDMTPKKCMFISGMDGKVIRGKLNADYWVRHTREPVRFVQASRVMWEEGCKIFVECGPQPVLTALAKLNMMSIGGSQAVMLPSIKKGSDDWKTILDTLAKLWMRGTREVNWRGFEKYYDRKFAKDELSIIKEIQIK